MNVLYCLFGISSVSKQFFKVASFHLGDTFKNDIFYHNGVKIHALSLVTAKNIVVHVLIPFMEITSSDYKY